ncbi:diaminopimelate epimerase [Pseudomonas sp. MIS38]|uniref:diaminopimelate epimerase n=1 Tax=Pseudomonas sp. MIS38 TaxID=91465 RepID=UPI00223BC832|nr:diaminopimelate epimerase [Pseudomonas sp. MIS38]
MHKPPAAARLRFSKMHGAGNDMIILDLRDAQDPSRELCKYLANRHKGIGADMVLGVKAARNPSSVASFDIWTAQGESSRQCGNGARCVAAWLVRAGLTEASEFTLDSPSGTHRVRVMEDGNYQISMGAPNFSPAAIPVFGFDQAQSAYQLELAGQHLACSAVSMGNPHAVIEAERDQYEIPAVGSALQNSGYFSPDVNVGFVQLQSRNRIKLKVYEFGAGETLACGSGACAAVAVLARAGRVDRSVDVELPGGALEVTWESDLSAMYLSGPAEFVFDGELAHAVV